MNTVQNLKTGNVLNMSLITEIFLQSCPANFSEKIFPRIRSLLYPHVYKNKSCEIAKSVEPLFENNLNISSLRPVGVYYSVVSLYIKHR